MHSQRPGLARQKSPPALILARFRLGTSQVEHIRQAKSMPSSPGEGSVTCHHFKLMGAPCLCRHPPPTLTPPHSKRRTPRAPVWIHQGRVCRWIDQEPPHALVLVRCSAPATYRCFDTAPVPLPLACMGAGVPCRAPPLRLESCHRQCIRLGVYPRLRASGPGSWPGH